MLGRFRSRLAPLLGLTVCLGGSSALAASDADAEKLAALRIETDSLSRRLERLRQTSSERLHALGAERNELLRQLRLEQIRANTFKNITQKMARDLHQEQGQLDSYQGPLIAALGDAKRFVQISLPFKAEQRLRALNQIESELRGGSPNVAGALRRLWRFYEEEDALGKEVAFAQQPITLKGKTQLVDVIRIGMALLYFRTAKGEFGWAHQKGETWSFEAFTGPEEIETTRLLFSSFESNRLLGPQYLILPEIR